MPANARVFLLDALKPENSGKLGIYYYLTYYFYPREVAISLGQPPTFQKDGVTGRSPVSLEELSQAGYDFAVQFNADQSGNILTLGSMPLGSPDANPKPIPGDDWPLALLLPLAVAIAGSRLVRGLFRDLEGVLTTGELLASGLAVGAFFLTQLTLGLRLAGARWERALTGVVMVWAVWELALWLRRRRGSRLQLKIPCLWWLLLVPAASDVMESVPAGRSAGLQEFDAVAILGLQGQDIALQCRQGDVAVVQESRAGLRALGLSAAGAAAACANLRRTRARE